MLGRDIPHPTVVFCFPRNCLSVQVTLVMNPWKIPLGIKPPKNGAGFLPHVRDEGFFMAFPGF